MNFAGCQLSRRQAVLWGVVATSTTLHVAQATSLPTPLSLPEALSASLKNGSPLVVMASLDGCPFCKIARENYLAPMQGDHGLAIVQLNLRSLQTVVGFDGISYSHDQLLKHWGIKVAPTVLFFGGMGQEVAERLVGGYLPDFYGAYLDDRLSVARAAVVARQAKL